MKTRHPLFDLAKQIHELARRHEAWSQGHAIVDLACSNLELLGFYHETIQKEHGIKSATLGTHPPVN